MSASHTSHDPLILAIETATRSGSVAVARGEKVLSSRQGDASVSHSTNLIEMIEAVLREASAKLFEIDLFAAATGPGSFTGLRIGLATVKAFAASADRRIAPVSTLAAIAHGAGRSEHTVALLPAGRGELFGQMFSVIDGDVHALDDAAHLSPKQLLVRYGGISSVLWAGEGAQNLDEYLTEFGVPPLGGMPPKGGTPNMPPKGGTPNARSAAPLAISVAVLALEAYRERTTVTAEELQAVYVRLSDAEINERWQQQNAQ